MVLFHRFSIFVCFIILCLSFQVVAQDEEEDPSLIKRYAETSFRDKDYVFALENYLKLNILDDENIEYKLRIGICYVETNINKVAAIPYLEEYISRTTFDKQAFYYLGRAYMYAYRFTEAVEALYEYKISGINDEKMEEITRLITMAYYAQEQISFPKNITFERLDTNINTPFDDYFPFISTDGTTLLFTSNRKYVKSLETNIPKVYQNKFKKEKWEPSTEIETANFDNEEIVGMTPDASQLLLHSNGDYTSDDILLLTRKGNKFIKEGKEKLPNGLNTEGVEYGACLSPDGSTLYFASDRVGGRGKLDLYMSKKNLDGTWTEPENLGADINTEFDENFPNISADGKTLYFASKGHDNFGGYDIFSSNYSDEKKAWLAPFNLGLPINTPYDNKTISFSADKKTAYVAANRAEGIGNLDIYKITYIGDDVPSVIIAGTVLIGSPGSSITYSIDMLKVLVTIFDKFGNVYARYDVDESGQFFATVYPGEYKLAVQFIGKKEVNEEKIIITPEQASEPILKEVYLSSGQ